MRCYAEINLDKLKYNLDELLKKIDIKKIIAVIKANAYGHGSIEIFKYLLKYGITNFAVATIDEAIELNNINKDVKILILGIIDREDYKKIENTNIAITISSFNDLEYILKNNLKNKIHIGIDTGMTRLGFHKEDIIKLKKYINTLNIEGIFTHLSSVDFDEEYTTKQIEEFLDITKELNLKKHILNSAGIEKYYNTEYILDYVRPGISLFGGENGVYKDVLSLYSHIVNIMKVPKNTYVGYNKTYKTTNDSYIGTISIGYADGYKRILSNKSYCFINGKRYKIIGNICMDICMVLIDGDVKIGDKVELIGDNIKIDEIAKLSDTIKYEILTSISNRVPRKYIEGNRYVR